MRDSSLSFIRLLSENSIIYQVPERKRPLVTGWSASANGSGWFIVVHELALTVVMCRRGITDNRDAAGSPVAVKASPAVVQRS
ncbi:MAG: hypothetical protein AB8B97_01535 [Granulosicoccus sp.]